MRWFCALAVSFCLTWSVGAQPADKTVKGIIFNLVKDVNTPTGTITIASEGSATTLTTIIINDKTKFETLRPNGKPYPSSFLAEHRGDKALVYLKADSDPKMPVATRVQVLLPPLPPPDPWIKRPDRDRAHIHGTVVHLHNDLVTIHLHHHDPLPAVSGTVVNTTRQADKFYGSMTIKDGDGKSHTYTVNRWTTFLKVKGSSAYQHSDFIADYKGATVIVFPRVNDKTVAAKVEVVIDGLAEALHRAKYSHNHHWLVFQLTKTTKFDTLRDGKKKATDVKALAIGEYVAIQGEKDDPHLAKHINIIQPHSLHGALTGITPKGVTLKVHHYGNMDVPTHDTPAFVPFTPGTVFETGKGKDLKKIDSAALTKALAAAPKDKPVMITVRRSGIPPHAAEVVELALANPKTVKTPKGGKKKGHLVSATGGVLVLSEANDVTEKFQMTPTTVLELHKGKDVTPANAADVTRAVKQGLEVTIHFTPVAGANAAATKVEIHDAKTKKKKK